MAWFIPKPLAPLRLLVVAVWYRYVIPAPRFHRTAHSYCCKALKPKNLRMERHCSNALALAEYLVLHPAVSWVNYGALPSSPYQDNCHKITGGKASGIISFGIKAATPEEGKIAGGRFIDALQMILRLVNIGDAKSFGLSPCEYHTQTARCR